MNSEPKGAEHGRREAGRALCERPRSTTAPMRRPPRSTTGRGSTPPTSSPARGAHPERRTRTPGPTWSCPASRFESEPTTTSSSSAAARRASTAPARWPRAACGSPSSSASWSAASAPTGRASRPRRCCARARRCTARARRRASAEVDVEAALAWRDFMVSDYSDAGQERWLADNGIDLLRGTGRLAGPGVVEVDGVRAHRRPRRARERRRSDRAAGPRPARARGRLDQPRGDRHEGRPAPPADPGRRPGRASRWRRRCAASAARR